MNFSTDLPKSKPLVTYIVASTMKPSDPLPDNTKEIPCFRMHAVVLKLKGTIFKREIENQVKLNNGKGLILCHIRKIDLIENIVMEPIVHQKEIEAHNEELPAIESKEAKDTNNAQIHNTDVLVVPNPNEVGKFTKSKGMFDTIRRCKDKSYTEMYAELNKIEEKKD